ncbi:hypothetical protein F2Q70_00020474 [Brassica cretica]|uniref:Uncharacterized protein n=1 Tax=Brassica cretica TaxID=69181 RepID=A0A8S9HE33_BRACR|nr:hypothetical protein F2Q70_00020474 [Brassica cretica]KAF2556199.1 hypothetical protein F2Q68_00014016 [Brassica cretica]
MYHRKDELQVETFGNREEHQRNLAKLSPDQVIESHKQELEPPFVCVDDLIQEGTRRGEVSWATRWRL